MEHFNVPHSLPKRPRSLFREIKLKERKILDKLTSDGESAGTSGYSQSDNDDIPAMQDLHVNGSHEMYITFRDVANHAFPGQKIGGRFKSNHGDDNFDYSPGNSDHTRICHNSLFDQIRQKINESPDRGFSHLADRTPALPKKASRSTVSASSMFSDTPADTIKAADDRQNKGPIDNSEGFQQVLQEPKADDVDSQNNYQSHSDSFMSHRSNPDSEHSSQHGESNDSSESPISHEKLLSGRIELTHMANDNVKDNHSDSLHSHGEQETPHSPVHMETGESLGFGSEISDRLSEYSQSHKSYTPLSEEPRVHETPSQHMSQKKQSGIHSLSMQSPSGNISGGSLHHVGHPVVKQQNPYTPIGGMSDVPVATFNQAFLQHALPDYMHGMVYSSHKSKVQRKMTRGQLDEKHKSTLENKAEKQANRKGNDTQFETFMQKLKGQKDAVTLNQNIDDYKAWGQCPQNANSVTDKQKQSVSYLQSHTEIRTVQLPTVMSYPDISLLAGSIPPSIPHKVNFPHGSVVQTPNGLAYLAPLQGSIAQPTVAMPAVPAVPTVPMISSMCGPLQAAPAISQSTGTVQVMQVSSGVVQPMFVPMQLPDQPQQEPKQHHPQHSPLKNGHVQQHHHHQQQSHRPGADHRDCQTFRPLASPRELQSAYRQQNQLPVQTVQHPPTLQQQSLPLLPQPQQEYANKRGCKPSSLSPQSVSGRSYQVLQSNQRVTKNLTDSSSCEFGVKNGVAELQEGMVLDPVPSIPGMNIQTVTENGQIELDRRDIVEGMMMCLICEDRATGLHYGIITCEGCKGFFKRTVQNKRIYTCSGDEDCEVNKSQRNRCQFCRFKKCIQKGMVVAAVREDRMPGGRNSGAVYNMFKFKYKRHRRKASSRDSQCKRKSETSETASDHTDSTSVSELNMHNQISQTWLDDVQRFTLTERQGQPQGQFQGQSELQGHYQGQAQETPVTSDAESTLSMTPQNKSLLSTDASSVNTTVSTSPHELIQKSSFDRNTSVDDNSKPLLLLINNNIKCECFHDITRFAYRVEHEPNVTQMLSNLGSDIVNHLVQWAQKLPFFGKIPMSSHLHILTSKWHEVLFLTTAAYQTIVDNGRNKNHSLKVNQEEFKRKLHKNFRRLHAYMTRRLRQNITMEQLQKEVQTVMEAVTAVILNFGRLKVTLPEYTCLKVILLLNLVGEERTPVTSNIQQEYMDALEDHIAHHHPESSNRFGELILLLSQVQSAASLLLQSRMIFVPFLLSNLAREHNPENA